MSAKKKTNVQLENPEAIKANISRIKRHLSELENLGFKVTSLEDLETFGKPTKLSIREQEEKECKLVMESWNTLSEKDKLLAYLRFSPVCHLMDPLSYFPVKSDSIALKHTIFWLCLIYDGSAVLDDFDVDCTYTPQDQLKQWRDFVEAQSINYIKTKFLEGCKSLKINTDPSSAEHKSYHKNVKTFFEKNINTKPKKTSKK